MKKLDYRDLESLLSREEQRTSDNLRWLWDNMPPYFFVSMREIPQAVLRLVHFLGQLPRDREVVLLDQDHTIVTARINSPGSVHDTLRRFPDRDISYAEMTRSRIPALGADKEVEVFRFETRRKTGIEMEEGGETPIPGSLRRVITSRALAEYPDFQRKDIHAVLDTLWASDPGYIRSSPLLRVARTLRLLHLGRASGGLYMDVESSETLAKQGESRLIFAVDNPPQVDFLAQVLEVLNRLDFGVDRFYCLIIRKGALPYFLGSFYGASRSGELLTRDMPVFESIKRELYNTQVLATGTPTYTSFVRDRFVSGEDASLINAFIAFCHTTLAHSQPERYGLEDVMRAFHSHPDMCLRLTGLFRARFDPDLPDRKAKFDRLCEKTREKVKSFNTGHRHIDEFRREVFHACITFIRNTLKTNFFVPEKHALAFRLDPAYLKELPSKFTADLPTRRPFRVTFFFGRHGIGYHVGYSDIARGGWRTVITRSRDDYVTNANPLFREVCVLAHTQHLKNKDIYEGGSKMVAILDAEGTVAPEGETQRLHRLQYGFINAFFDIFATREGRAVNPRVVDYWGEEEPIELGPDENMHDAMVEQIAKLSVSRGYVLGRGVMSSKRVGINHKEHGVTSIGVIKFAEVVMKSLGVDIFKDPFSVKMTGGPGGDVAGNALRILIDASPGVSVLLVLDGSGALYDPGGLDKKELRRIIHRGDAEAFDPGRIHPGGFLLYRNQRRIEGPRELYRKAVRTDDGVDDRWVTTDAFNRHFEGLVYSTEADLLIPAGGRPETIDDYSWPRLFRDDGSPTCRVIVEGANSFLTPTARDEIQQRGVIVIRDASANKCGVIASSYEIIANLLMSDREFLAHKEEYVGHVIDILKARSEAEARLILKRHLERGGRQSFTEISDTLSLEINDLYQRLFAYFQRFPDLWRKPLYRECLLGHLPELIRETPRYRRRIGRLPPKYRNAILAAELAASMVYTEQTRPTLEESVTFFLRRRRAEREGGGKTAHRSPLKTRKQ